MSSTPLAGQADTSQISQQIGPFARLRHLLAEVAPPENKPVFDLTIGAPRHAPPEFVLEKLTMCAAQNGASYGRYPPIEGLPIWQDAVRGWLARRFGLKNPCPQPHQVLPVSGTREGLFLLAQLARPNRSDKTLMAMPNHGNRRIKRLNCLLNIKRNSDESIYFHRVDYNNHRMFKYSKK